MTASIAPFGEHRAVHDPMVVDDANVDRAIITEYAVIEHSRDRCERVQRFSLQCGIDGEPERAEIIAALASDIEAKPP